MTATVCPADQVVVVQPGVYDLTDEQYHADPVPGGSLSSTGARKLLPPGCPARYQYEVNHPPAPTRVLELGRAAHRLVLGAGPTLTAIDADDWRSAEARQRRDEAYQAGAVPLLRADYDQVHAMADALAEHPVASALFHPDHGRPEQSLFWTDPSTGMWRRARLDWLPYRHTGRAIVGDYKTCRSANPDDIQRAIHVHGYHQQAAWYLDAGHELGLFGDGAFVFVFQEKTPPYVVTVVEPDPIALRIGRALNRRALDIFFECSTTGHWPGYADDVIQLGLPRWAEARYLEESDGY